VQPRHVQGAVSAPALSAIFRRMQTVLWKVDDNRSMKCSRQCRQHIRGRVDRAGIYAIFRHGQLFAPDPCAVGMCI